MTHDHAIISTKCQNSAYVMKMSNIEVVLLRITSLKCSSIIIINNNHYLNGIKDANFFLKRSHGEVHLEILLDRGNDLNFVPVSR